MSTTYAAKKQPLLHQMASSVNHHEEYASPVTSTMSAPDCSPFHLRHRKHWQLGGHGTSPISNKRRKRPHRRYDHKSLRQKAEEQINRNTHGVWITTLIKQDSKTTKHIHCVSVCERYDVDGIFDLFTSNIENHAYSMFARYEDVLHFKATQNSPRDNQSNDSLRSGNLHSIVEDEDIFVFQNEGVIVFWNVKQATRCYFISKLELFQINYPIQELSDQIVPQSDVHDYGLEGAFEIERGGKICLSLLDCFDQNNIEICTECLTECALQNEHKLSLNRRDPIQQRPNSMRILMENEQSRSDRHGELKENRDNTPIPTELNQLTQSQREPDWSAVRGVLMCQKLAISFGLAQSLKLTLFELRIDGNIELNADIPKQMASDGSIGLNGKEMARRHGRLFLLRSELNLHSDVLDYPEHLYENDLFGKEYERIRDNLDIDERMEIINARFDLLHELFEIVVAQQESSHSACLEWIVIWLIVVEIVLGLTELVIPYFSDLH